MLTLSVKSLKDTYDGKRLAELLPDNDRYSAYVRYQGTGLVIEDLWPLGAGIWSVPVTFTLLVGMIYCHRMQRVGKDISKTITVIKALVSSI